MYNTHLAFMARILRMTVVLVLMLCETNEYIKIIDMSSEEFRRTSSFKLNRLSQSVLNY